MSHSHLLLRGIPDLADPRHLEVVRERLTYLENTHRKRIANIELDRRIISGDIWKAAPSEDEQRVTLSTGKRLVNLGSSMILPRPPSISVMPTSQDYIAQREADAVTRWIYAALDNLQAYPSLNAWAKEVIGAGSGFLHMIPDALAMPDELPLLLDVPDSCSVLYHTGPRGTMDYCFIRHEMTRREMERTLGIYADRNDRETTVRETWCYYTEERFVAPETGRVEKRILYGILDRSDWLYPLTDITEIMPEIPVFGVFNADGFNWRGREEMRARGILTDEQEKLLLASDMFSQIANGMMRVIAPPLAVYADDNAEPIDLDLRPHAQNSFQPGEKVEPLVQMQPDQRAVQFYPQIMQEIASGTYPQMLLQAGDLEGVSGSAFAEHLHPSMVRTQIQQQNLAVGIRQFITTMLRHMATVIDPLEGLALYGVDPRDQQQLMEIVHPEMLLRHTRVRVTLTQQTPRNVFQYLNIIQQLGREGYLPRQLVTEQSAELLQLPVTDMSSVMGQIAADDQYRLQMEMLKNMAAQAEPHFRQALYNREQNPALLSDGTKPYQMSSEGQDPRLPETVRPVGPRQIQARMERPYRRTITQE